MNIIAQKATKMAEYKLFPLLFLFSTMKERLAKFKTFWKIITL